jgi:hypothetical protein
MRRESRVRIAPAPAERARLSLARQALSRAGWRTARSARL